VSSYVYSDNIFLPMFVRLASFLCICRLDKAPNHRQASNERRACASLAHSQAADSAAQLDPSAPVTGFVSVCHPTLLELSALDEEYLKSPAHLVWVLQLPFPGLNRPISIFRSLHKAPVPSLAFHSVAAQPAVSSPERHVVVMPKDVNDSDVNDYRLRPVHPVPRVKGRAPNRSGLP
jgi:hypothetical protein